MIRVGRASRVGRRTLLRGAFLSAAGLAGTEIVASVAPFLKVQRIIGQGEPVPVGPKADILARFAATGDAPILFSQGRFFLLHPPGGIVAAYRKCTHLGCAVPFSVGEDRFHCPCHGSIYDKRTAVVIRDPAPKPLQLFHIRETEAGLIVDTNPQNVIDRSDNRWDPRVIEIDDSAI
ncbi:MAG TPA: Rieske 2Fe-2S domain-containing protein [Candidatus Limnocylindria bacterium]|nr:Rieske 2Fe-2S domain-containing protein [Candidatus Limnocylindria bacterium]